MLWCITEKGLFTSVKTEKLWPISIVTRVCLALHNKTLRVCSFIWWKINLLHSGFCHTELTPVWIAWPHGAVWCSMCHYCFSAWPFSQIRVLAALLWTLSKSCSDRQTDRQTDRQLVGLLGRQFGPSQSTYHRLTQGWSTSTPRRAA